MKLSAVKQVNVNKIKKNPLNAKYFDNVDGKEMTQLAEDIKKRGILVPLVMKSDGTLLAGHTRLLIAKSIGMKTVPVQMVMGKIGNDEETQFIVKDNLLRRHLTSYQRQAIYEKMFPEFKERVIIKNDKSGIGMDYKEVSRKTGIPEVTVENDLHIIRKKEIKKLQETKEIKPYDEDLVIRVQKNMTLITNQCAISNKRTIEEIEGIMRICIDRVKIMLDNAKE